MRKLATLVALLALFALALTPTLAQEDGAHVRVAHFSPETGPVDVYVNGELSDITELEYGSVTGWVELPAGAYDLAVAPAGTSLEDAVLTADGVELADGDWITVAAIGIAERGTLALQPIIEDFSDLGLGVTRVTLFHAISEAVAVDVYVDDNLLVRGLTYPGDAAALGISDEPAANDGTFISNYDAGTYDIQVTALDDVDTVLFDLPATDLNAGFNYFIAAVGTAEDNIVVVAATNVDSMMSETPAEPMAMEFDTCEGSGDANVRVAHFAQLAREDETSAVDIYLNGEAAGISLDYGDVTDFVEVPAGNYDVAVVPAGGDVADAEIIAEGFPICADQHVTAVAHGLRENNSLMLAAVVEDFSPLGLNTARVTVFHAIAGGPLVNVIANESITLVEGLSYPGAAAELGISDEPSANDGYAIIPIVDAGVYDIQVVSFNDPETVILEFQDLSLENGRSYFIAAIGTPGAPDFSLAIVPVE
jgi:hypothetical protein